MTENTKTEIKIREAFYLTSKSGGFQAHRVLIQDDKIISHEKFSDPDAWDPIMNIIEHELSKKFQ